MDIARLLHALEAFCPNLPSPAGRGRGWGSAPQARVQAIGVAYPHPTSPSRGRGFAGVLFAAAASLALAGCSAERAPADPSRALAAAHAEAPAPAPEGDRVLLWGDTHLHTRNSVDAFGSGKGSTDIDTAYRFAKGFPVVFPRTGARVRIDRPLDFLVVADHDVNLGVSSRIQDNDPEILKLPIARRLKQIFDEQGGSGLTAAVMGRGPLTPDERAQFNRELHTPEVLGASWEGQIAAAEKYNEPGVFTALIGWEWTSAPNMRNLHRVVFTNVDGDVARKFLPFANWMSERPEDLWAFFEQTKARTGADFVAMPHNANLSDGKMYALQDSDGNPFTAEYARRRALWEPVTEVTQYKGTSETHPALSATDEFAGFELRNMLLTGVPTEVSGGSYVRSALLRGIAEEQRIGVNPFRLGMIGSTDSHTGLVSVREQEFYGKLAEDYLPRERLGPNKVPIIFPAAEMSASGLAAAWADSNTRQGLFDAFRRREVYGTSGPRISLRLFAGYGFARGDEAARDFGAIGYRKGVPMGGQLAPSTGGAPHFVIRAAKDPLAAGLDRVQVVKGWVDAAGTTHERIYDVAWFGAGRQQADGSLRPVANPVDMKRWRDDWDAGASELTAFWSDPDFDPKQRAFYYVRVLQVPTIRHHVYDALALGIDPTTLGLPTTIQERAWSSPVWYRP